MAVFSAGSRMRTIKNVVVGDANVNIELSGWSYAGGLVGAAIDGSSSTNSTTLNQWVNTSGSGTINIGRFIGYMNPSPTLTDNSAWRHMEFNISNSISYPTGEPYFLSFTRKSLKINSYESDAILTKVETWANGVVALN